MTSNRPTRHVAVIMRRQRIDGPMRRWQPWRWVLDSVVPHEAAFGSVARLLREDDVAQHWLHPGFAVELFRDDAEGYYLNATTDAPGWFVMWRLQQDAAWGPEPMPVPCMVSLSYHDAGRWLDAQETVEQVPLPPDVRAWLQAFVDEHHVIEPKRRKRPESFRPLQDRFGNPVSISVGKKAGGGHG
ncbi:MAG: DUF3305 domain-containing protein [Burkholderiaceae bacterium]